jgi:hypothetical protein
MVNRNRFLLMLALSLVLIGVCYGEDKNSQGFINEIPGISSAGEDINSNYDPHKMKFIIVNKIPRGAYAGEEMPHNIGWYEVGLSRNGKEPIEYIWRTGGGPTDYDIMNAGIGDKGTVHLENWAKLMGRRLPRPNATNPPRVGLFGEVYWKNQRNEK